MSEIDLSSPLNYGTPSSLGSVRTPSGIRGTPIRMRPDIRTDRRIRQVNVASDPVSFTQYKYSGINIKSEMIKYVKKKGRVRHLPDSHL